MTGQKAAIDHFHKILLLNYLVLLRLSEFCLKLTKLQSKINKGIFGEQVQFPYKYILIELDFTNYITKFVFFFNNKIHSLNCMILSDFVICIPGRIPGFMTNCTTCYTASQSCMVLCGTFMIYSLSCC